MLWLGLVSGLGVRLRLGLRARARVRARDRVRACARVRVRVHQRRAAHRSSGFEEALEKAGTHVALHLVGQLDPAHMRHRLERGFL